MFFEEKEYGASFNILKRRPFEGVPMTLDFAGVSGDIAKAGSIVYAGGKLKNSGSLAVVGILLHDTDKRIAQGTVLKKAYIDEAKATAHSGATYSSDVKSALPQIVFE